MSVTYSECVSIALFIQHAMLRITLSSVAFPAVGYHIFPHYLTNGKIFGKKFI